MKRMARFFAALGASAALACSIAIAAPTAAPSTPYGKRDEVRVFIGEMVERHGFVEKELKFLFSRARRLPAILKAIEPAPPAERSWEAYRAIFLSERHIGGGLEFWRAHGRALARAAKDYGVPEEVIVSIIGVETFYGRNTGRWRVVDALSTLAFDYPPRAEFFRKELENYLVLARDVGVDVFSVQGSYAGAIGIPQFMPSSYLKYAVDFDGNGVSDLRASPADAIGSVGNFLKEHGWRAGEPVLTAASLQGEAWRAYANGELEPRHALGELQKAGISPQEPAPAEAKAVVIELGTPQRASDWRLGFHNFWVLTRYNRSAFYASAVYDLAQELRSRRP
jgi:membrane-bound lytic murein transglycosylase B